MEEEPTFFFEKEYQTIDDPRRLTDELIAWASGDRFTDLQKDWWKDPVWESAFKIHSHWLSVIQLYKENIIRDLKKPLEWNERSKILKEGMDRAEEELLNSSTTETDDVFASISNADRIDVLEKKLRMESKEAEEIKNKIKEHRVTDESDIWISSISEMWQKLLADRIATELPSWKWESGADPVLRWISDQNTDFYSKIKKKREGPLWLSLMEQKDQIIEKKCATALPPMAVHFAFGHALWLIQNKITFASAFYWISLVFLIIVWMNGFEIIVNEEVTRFTFLKNMIQYEKSVILPRFTEDHWNRVKPKLLETSNKIAGVVESALQGKRHAEITLVLGTFILGHTHIIDWTAFEWIFCQAMCLAFMKIPDADKTLLIAFFRRCQDILKCLKN
jgi:hypothetical protein